MERDEKKIKKLGYVFPELYSFVNSENNFSYPPSENLITNPLDLAETPLNRPRLFLIVFHKNFFAKKIKEKKIIVSKSTNKNSLSIYEGEWLQPVNEIVSLELEEEKKKVLDIWSDLLDKISYHDLPHPLWLEFFFSIPSLKKRRGIISFLKSFYKRHGSNKILELLADKKELQKHEKFAWKIGFAQKNWYFYLKHKEKIDNWWKVHKKSLQKKNTYCKLELNIKNYYLVEKFPDFFFKERCIIQFRHSGIRIKPSTYFPTVTRHSSLIIIYDKNWKKYRYLSQQEMLRIFDFSQWKEWKEKGSKAEFVSSLGESISVSVLKTIIENFRPEIEKIIGDKQKNLKFFVGKPNLFETKEFPWI